MQSDLSVYSKYLPSGHMTYNDVALTSMRRDKVVSTSIHFGTINPLGPSRHTTWK